MFNLDTEIKNAINPCGKCHDDILLFIIIVLLVILYILIRDINRIKREKQQQN